MSLTKDEPETVGGHGLGWPGTVALAANADTAVTTRTNIAIITAANTLFLILIPP